MPKGTPSKPPLAKVIDAQTPLIDCPGVGILSVGDNRCVQEFVRQLRWYLLIAAEVSANSEEILTAVERGIAEEVHRLLNDDEKKPIGEAIQRLARSIQRGAGNPPRQAAKTIKEDLPPLDTTLKSLLNKLEFSVRTGNLIPQFLTEQFPDKKPLTVHDFLNAFSQDGRFDTTKFRAKKGVGQIVYNEFLNVLRQAEIITGANEWEPSFLVKYSL